MRPLLGFWLSSWVKLYIYERQNAWLFSIYIIIYITGSSCCSNRGHILHIMWCHMTQEYYGLSMGISKISRYLHTSCLWALGHSYMILTFIPFNVLWHKKQEYFVIGSGVAQWFSRFFVPSSFMGIRAIPYDLDIHSIWCDMTQEKKNILGSCFNRVT